MQASMESSIKARLFDANDRYEMASASFASPENGSSSLIAVSQFGLGAMVCDGIGNEQDAAFYAEIAARVGLSAIEDGSCAQGAIIAANEASESAKAQVIQRAGGASGTAIAIMQDGIEWASKGDIGVFLFSGGSLKMLSTPAGKLEGLPSDYLGKANFPGQPLDSGCVSIEKENDLFAIMTNGLWRTLGENRIEMLIMRNDDLASLAQSLIGSCLGISVTFGGAGVLLVRPARIQGRHGKGHVGR